jgi:hypothetical protein
MMSQENKNAKLIQTKLALAQKHENLAHVTKSKPKRKRLLHHAQDFRRQAEQLSRP